MPVYSGKATAARLRGRWVSWLETMADWFRFRRAHGRQMNTGVLGVSADLALGAMATLGNHAAIVILLWSDADSGL